MRRGGERRHVGRDLRAQRDAGLAQAEVEQRRDAHEHGADLGAPPWRSAARAPRAGAGSTTRPVSRSDCSTMWRAKSSTSSSSTRSFSSSSCAEPLDREQRLAQLVDLLRGEAPELRQAAGRGQQIAQAAELGASRRPPRSGRLAVGAAVGSGGDGSCPSLLPEVGRLGRQRRRRAVAHERRRGLPRPPAQDPRPRRRPGSSPSAAARVAAK